MGFIGLGPTARYGKDLMEDHYRDDLFRSVAEKFGFQFSKTGELSNVPLNVFRGNGESVYEIRSIQGVHKGKKIKIEDVIQQFGLKSGFFPGEGRSLPKIEAEEEFWVDSAGLQTLFFIENKIVTPPDATFFWIPMGVPSMFLASEKQILNFMETLQILK